MENKTIIHVSEVNISPNSGMGRVEYYWKLAFENAGYKFTHIGPAEVGPLKHPALFPYKAYKYYQKLGVTPSAFLVHEPAGGFFVNRGIPCVIESHGVERRYWEAQLNGSVPPAANGPISFKTKILLPLWRLRGCDRALKYADKLLLINSDDKEFVKNTFDRMDEDILMFKNGVNNILEADTLNSDISSFTILFNGNWLERKGIQVLINAAKELYQHQIKISYLLIGTGKDIESVLSDWPEELRPFVQIIPRFDSKDELKYLSLASLFVLPSYFEGQPLSLLQAMAAGKCSIATNCCGQKDIIQSGKTGFLFERGNHKQLANLIENCYENREMMTQVGNNARRFAQNLTWENVANEVKNFILSSI